MKGTFQIFKASAGSGKTYTLVLKYLELLFKSDDLNKFNKILGITFTNKAAAEMRERIVDSLISLSSNTNANLTAEIQKITSLNTFQIQQKAKEILSRILHNYSDLSVTTIDKFVQKISKAFAKELKLPTNYVVLLDQNEIVQEAIESIYSQYKKDKVLSDAIEHLIISKLNSDKKWKIDDFLVKMANEIFNETSKSHIQNIESLSLREIIKYKQSIKKYIDDIRSKVNSKGEEALKKIAENQLTESNFYYGSKGIYGFLKKAASFDKDKLNLNTYQTATLEQNRWNTPKNPDGIDNNIINYLKDTCLFVLELMNDSNYFTYYAILENIDYFIISSFISKELNRIQSEKEVIHISSFNHRINEIIKNEPIPFIYEKTGNKYKNIMIDEFQDTSPVQWENLLPLVENGISEGNLSLIVGDAKQAIYRFRGGDSKQFVELSTNSEEIENPLIAESIENINLEYNFRSNQHVVAFNNHFFDKLNERFPILDNIYTDQKQKSVKNNNNGAVILKSFEKDEYKELTFTQLLYDVNELVNVKKFSYSDITILVRNNNEALKTAAFLLNNNINVVSTDGLTLYYSNDCKILINWLKYINDAKNIDAKFEILSDLMHRNLIPFSDEYFENHDRLYGINVFSLIQLDENKVRNTTSLIQLVNDIGKCIKLLPSNSIGLLTFIDMLANFELQKNSNIGDFIDYWGQTGYKTKIESSENEDAVNILTMHKSKGLQFPVVILPFVGNTRKNNSDKIWLDFDDDNLPKLKSVMVNKSKYLLETIFKTEYLKLLESDFIDDINLLYVAFTRPETALYIYLSNENLLDRREPNDASFPTLNTIMLDFVNINSLGFENTEASYYVYGNEHFKKESKEKTKNSDENLVQPFNTIALHANFKLLPEFNSSSSEIGSLFHKVIQNSFCKSDAMVELEKLDIDHAKKEKLNHYINLLFENKLLNKWLSSKEDTYSERELLSNSKIFRPDRVIKINNSFIVLDFKTGDESEKHTDQIKQYIDILKTVENSEAEGYLIYLQNQLLLKKVS